MHAHLEELTADKGRFKNEFGRHLAHTGFKIELSVTDYCTIGCLHCLTSATRQGKNASLSQLQKLDSRYLKRKVIGFGSGGEPLEYRDGESDLSDVAALFASRGASSINFLTAGFTADDMRKIDVVRKLRRLRRKGIVFPFLTLSAHLYWPRRDEDVFSHALSRAVDSIIELTHLTSEIHLQVRMERESRMRNETEATRLVHEIAGAFKSRLQEVEGQLVFLAGRTLVLVAAQKVENFGRWINTKNKGSIGFLTSEERFDAYGAEDPPTRNERRWTTLEGFESLWISTNGDVDLAYSIPVLGKPRQIANVYEHSYEEVVDRWLEHLFEHLLFPNRGKFKKILEEGGYFFEG